MPKCAVEPGDGYELPPVYPCRVIDAEGRDVADCLRCDTDTGTCEVYATDADGAYVFDLDAGEIATHWVQRPAPLTLKALT